MSIKLDDYDDFVDEDIRLIILRALAEEDNATMHDGRLQIVLERFGYNKPRDYIRNQLVFLEKQASAIRTTAPGTVVVATLRKAGRDHVNRAAFLVGVKRPSDID